MVDHSICLLHSHFFKKVEQRLDHSLIACNTADDIVPQIISCHLDLTAFIF